MVENNYDILGIVEGSTKNEIRDAFRRLALQFHSDRGGENERQGKVIKNLRTAFEGAKDRAKIQDVVIHDFRHTAITRWAVLGVPQEAAMLASGHKSLAMHYRYANLQPHHVRAVFTRCLQEKQVDETKSVSY